MTAQILLHPSARRLDPVKPHVSMLAFRVISVLTGVRFPLSTEKRLQEMICAELARAGIEHEREARAGDGVIDLLAGEVGIEVKIDGSARAIHRQLRRYAMDSRIGWLILVTNRTIRLPERIEGKPATVFSLGRGWL